MPRLAIDIAADLGHLFSAESCRKRHMRTAFNTYLLQCHSRFTFLCAGDLPARKTVISEILPGCERKRVIYLAMQTNAFKLSATVTGVETGYTWSIRSPPPSHAGARVRITVRVDQQNGQITTD